MLSALQSNLHVLSLFGSLGVGLAVLFLRIRAGGKPVNAMKIIMPPIGMSTGFLMFLVPAARIPWEWALYAFVIGSLLFSYPLIRTSRFYKAGNEVYLQRSKAFMAILLALLAVRLALHEYIESYISFYQTGAVFFILAFGMILPWRAAMYVRYRSLLRGRP